MDQISLALLSVFFLLVSILWYSWIFKNSTKKLPPGPRGVPILGYLPFLSHNLHIQLTDLARKYGPIYKLWLGTKLCVVISSPSLIKEVVRDHDAVFANHDPTVAGLVATGGVDIVNSPYGPHWRNLRKVFVREMLSNKNLDDSGPLRRYEVRRAVRNLYGKIGTNVDVGELIFITEVNVVLCLIWGGALEGEKRDKIGARFREKVAKFVELLGKPNLSDFFPILAKFDFQGIEREMKGVMPSVDEILDSVISDRMKIMEDSGGEFSSANRRKDFVQILLDLMKQNVGDQAMDVAQIKGLLMDIVIGGTDTTATIVEWVMAELLQSPHAMQKAQQELTEVVGLSNIVEESHITKLHYLDAVIRETFRLHPPLPLLIPKMPSKSCTIGGYTVPEGSRVLLNVWTNYKDPQVWENPTEFKPERFLNDDDDNGKWDYIGNNFHYLPFGSGRRVCPGIPLAERMVTYLVATLLHSFDWKVSEGVKLDMEEKFGIVMKKSTPLLAVPYQRLPSLNMYE
ncbi:hypothetical protein ABFS83_01G085300 [Erythranthe nasuta]